MIFKLVMRVRDLPLESVVTKMTGKVKFLVKDMIRIHGEKKYQEIKAESGTRFLVAVDGGNISCVNGDLEVIWEVNYQDMMDYFDNTYET